MNVALSGIYVFVANICTATIPCAVDGKRQIPKSAIHQTAKNDLHHILAISFHFKRPGAANGRRQTPPDQYQREEQLSGVGIKVGSVANAGKLIAIKQLQMKLYLFFEYQRYILERPQLG